MNKLFLIMILIIGLSVQNCSGKGDEGATQSKMTQKKGQNINLEWLTFDSGLAKSSKEKKHMIVDFYTDWCHWCKVMDEKTFNNPEIKQKLNERFITVRLEAENSSQTATFKGNTYNNVQLTQAFGVTGFPSLAFINYNEEIVTLIPGYVPPETFIHILNYMDQECYKKQMSFEDFMKKKGECEEKEAKKL